MCIYDDKKIEDVAEFEGDDPIDCLRYFCKAAKQFLDGEIVGLDRATRVDNITQQLRVTGDMTSFYRKMEAIEKDDKQTMGDCIPISRRSRFARRMH